MYKITSILFSIIYIISFSVFAQTSTEAPASAVESWHHLDRVEDNYNGISTTKAYELLKDKESKTVIVAVIDSGLDTEHEDLQGSLWVNEDEIAGNGIDDDNNGYIDDINGWNFLGNLEKDTYELTRVYKIYLDRFGGKEEGDIAEKDKEDYTYYLKLKKELDKQKESTKSDYDLWKPIVVMYDKSYRLITAYLDVDTLNNELLQNVNSPDEKISKAVEFLRYITSIDGFSMDIARDQVESLEFLLQYGYDPEYDQREIVGDNYEDLTERIYGSNFLKVTPSHGTQVAGVIAAQRGNQLGMDGIADNVKIMGVRAVPDGDERDKDIANAIRYAVDNGAQIINMSFGKSYSPYKEAVDEAVAYAEQKGVLLIHAAGNSHKDVDVKDNFPTREFNSGKEASNWIEVGASSWGGEENFVASFSNYGKKTVDVFAPGVAIYTTSPDNGYNSVDGTSFAAPVTTGVAALLMSYYPDLSINDVREIILKSATTFSKIKVPKPAAYGSDAEMVKFSDLSITGGIVNAYEAVKLAESRKVRKN